MHNIIVGTAGHVDHGKTCLIKSLTGVDTDRLQEEKKKGITIDLGFAQLPNDNKFNIGVIDVPGHEKFIKNMLAGIGGIDLVLLVIAADEGIMPQTKEHFEILKLLRIDQGIIVLTKADLVDDEWLAAVEDDVKTFVKGTFLENATIMRVSAYTGQNIAELKKLICKTATNGKKRQTDPELLRIPIDRVFTMEGFGTVITGTLIQGTITVGEEVEIYPEGKLVKVRNLQVHGQAVEKAYAGQRTAVNLSGMKKGELKRGDVLAAKGTLTCSMMLDVKIEMFQNSPRRLFNGSRVHLYYGSAEVLCKVVLLDSEFLDPGQTGYAQLRLEEEIAVRKEDRFILRFYSPVESIGGGVVLDSNPPRRKRFDPEVLEALTVKEKGGRDVVFEQVLKEESAKMKTLDHIRLRCGMSRKEVSEMADMLAQTGKAVKLTEDIVIHRTYMDLAEEQSTILLTSYHEKNPLKAGMQKEEFRKKLGERLHLDDCRINEALLNKILDERVASDSGNTIALPKFRVSFTPMQKNLKDRIENECKRRRYKMPEAGEILEMDKDKALVRQMIAVLRSEGRLEEMASNYYIHTECLSEALSLLRNFIKNHGSITLSEYRDLLGTSRKYAAILLEHFDREKITGFINDARVLIG